jgi:hypothetical protein
MVRCWKCGRENEEGMRFCTNCGNPLTTSPSAGGADAGYNPSVSETISFNAPPQTAVGGMGTPTSPYTSAPPFTESAPRKSKTGLIIGLIVGALLLGIVGIAGVGGYYYYSNSKQVVSNNGNSNKGNKNQATLDPDTKPSPAPANANDTPPSEPTPTPASKQLFEPPTTPTKEGSFTVYANEGWQLSDIAVVPLEKFTTRTTGIVDIAGVKTGVNPGGINDAKFKSRRLFPEYPLGALIMRTRYANGRFSNMQPTRLNGSWENLPDERGMLEFIINDNAPQDNGGQFTIKVKLTSVPKK